MFRSLSTSWAHTQLSCLIPGTRASQPATQGIPVFSYYVLDCYVIHSHSVCFWKFIFLGDACEIGCLGKCQPLHSSGRIRMHNPGKLTCTFSSPRSNMMLCSWLWADKVQGCWKGQEKSAESLVPSFTSCDLEWDPSFPTFSRRGSRSPPSGQSWRPCGNLRVSTLNEKALRWYQREDLGLELKAAPFVLLLASWKVVDFIPFGLCWCVVVVYKCVYVLYPDIRGIFHFKW